MTLSSKMIALIARVFLALIFLLAALGKITGWAATSAYMASKGIPAIPVFLTMAIIAETVGGLSVLTGFRSKLGAWILIAFLIPTTFIFHNFWSLHGMDKQMQMMNFMKNLSILGGLLLVVATSPDRT